MFILFGLIVLLVGCGLLLRHKRLRISYLEILNQYYRCALILLELNYGASSLDSLLQVLGLVLRHAFLQCRRSTVYEILSLLQTKTTSLLNGLYNLQLSCTGLFQNYVERSLLFCLGSSATSSRTSSNSNSCSSGLNSILVLQDCCQLVYFLNCKIY